MTAQRGALVVLEGAEGVGKSTQACRLADSLRRQGIATTQVREPGGTELGDEVRRLVLDSQYRIDPSSEALLFMASRAQLVADVIRPALGRGELVLADRFLLSTYAYQVFGRGLPESEVRSANRLATADLVPALTILLTLPIEESLARMRARPGNGPDRIEQADAEFHLRVARAFRDFVRPAWQSNHPEAGRIVAVEAAGTEEEVTQRILAVMDIELRATIMLEKGSNQ